MEHTFLGKWITDSEMFDCDIINVFHKQLTKIEIAESRKKDAHILFRKSFYLESLPQKAVIYITADDYFKLYINGEYVIQGPAPAYRFAYGYLEVDITKYLTLGKNVLAAHTLYQGLINRVWLSGDNCHGLIFDIIADGECIAKSDETVLVATHDGFTPLSTVGYSTQFMEKYDSRASKVGFERVAYDDSTWQNASIRKNLDYTLVPQATKALAIEKIKPTRLQKSGSRLLIDFGSTYVGQLYLTASGESGDEILMRFGQEINDDGTLRYNLRANCVYEESWVLSGDDDEEDELDQYDSMSFRYVELTVPENVSIGDISFIARHYPFKQACAIKPELMKNEALCKIFNLCSHSLEYGVQEVIQDCMEREKGFYVGDGCYSAFAHMVLTGDDSIVRKLINDAFASSFICDTLVTCLDCSFMQEIAEYPLMMISLILWHYRFKGDKPYLSEQYPKICKLLDAYKRDYEKNYLMCDLDKWCVVEWPANFQDGYDVDIAEHKVCHEPHIAMNAYYLEAIKTANKIAKILGLEPYRNEQPIVDAIKKAFFDENEQLYCDGINTRHKSFIGNVLAFYAGLFDTDASLNRMLDFIKEKGMTSVSLFGPTPLLIALVRCNRYDLALELISDKNAWLRIIREGGTTTFEGWGKDTKWNTSLFHLTLTLASIFLADVDQAELFK